MKNLNRKKQVQFCLTGSLMIGLGVAVCRSGQIGVDPFNAMCIGISGQLGIGLGTVFMVCQVLLLVFVIFLNKSYIGLGTIINGVFLGWLVDGITAVLRYMFPLLKNPVIGVRIFCMVIGILVLTLGISLYFTGDLGIAPYDAVGKILMERANFSYAVSRVLTDGFSAIIAFLFKGPIGIGTIVITCFSGPLVQIWNKKISEPLFHKGERDV